MSLSLRFLEKENKSTTGLRRHYNLIKIQGSIWKYCMTYNLTKFENSKSVLFLIEDILLPLRSLSKIKENFVSI